MKDQDTTRKDRKQKRKEDGDLTTHRGSDLLQFTIDSLPVDVSTSTLDPAPSWDSGFGGGDTGGGGGGADF